MFDIITFGSNVIDAFVFTEIKNKKNFICYELGSKILIEDLKFDIGGGGVNTAVAFSRLGLKTGYIGKIGNKDFGYRVLKILNEEKIKFLGSIDNNHINGFSVILDSVDKSRTILTYKGVNDTIDYEDLKIKKIKTKWIYLTSLMSKSFETQKKISFELHNKGTKIVFNPSEYLIKKKDLTELLRICEILILNKEEAKLLSNKYKIKEKNILMALNSLGPKIIVITDKDKETKCYDSYSKRFYSIIPHKIKVIERTGAGDAFGSGFVAGMVCGLSINDCLKLGLKESESVIKYFGARNHLIKMNLKKIKKLK